MFTGQDSAMAKLMFSVMGGFAEFGRPRFGASARRYPSHQRGAYKDEKMTLHLERAAELVEAADSGIPKAAFAHGYGISRDAAYQHCTFAKPELG